MGEKRFFEYSARDNNCIDFQLEFSKTNELLTSEIQKWVKQDTKSLFGKCSFLRKFSDSVTESGARVDDLIGMEYYIN